MPKVVRYILITLAGVIVACCLTASYFCGVAYRKPLVCTGLKVVIADSLENTFVSRSDVKTYLDKQYGEYVGLPLDSLELHRMEAIIDSRSAVKKSEAFVTRDGILHISVTQRKPVVRFQKADGGFYADEEGYVFPLQNTFASHVQIIDGAIPLSAKTGYKGEIENKKEREWMMRMLDIVNFIEDSKVWKEKIVQINVDKEGNIIVVPRAGDELFLFGQPVKIEDKFERMGLYYSTIAASKGKDYYKTVDLRYDGQIVCRPKEETKK